MLLAIRNILPSEADRLTHSNATNDEIKKFINQYNYKVRGSFDPNLGATPEVMMNKRPVIDVFHG